MTKTDFVRFAVKNPGNVYEALKKRLGEDGLAELGAEMIPPMTDAEKKQLLSQAAALIAKAGEDNTAVAEAAAKIEVAAPLRADVKRG